MTNSTDVLAPFKAKRVPGLYSFNHFEHPDGRWIQVSLRGDVFIYIDAAARTNRFTTLAALRAHMEKEVVA